MAATLTTTTQLQKPVNVIFQQTLLRNAKARAPYFVGSEPGTLTQHGGTATIKWRRIENLTPTTTALSELTGTATFPTARDSVQPSVNDITATVSKYGQYILLNEEADLFNFNGQTDKLVEVLGISAGRSLNQLQRNELEDNSTMVFAGGAASDGVVSSKITIGAVKSIINTLEKNSAMTFTPEANGSTNVGTVPILPGYWGLCHPDVAIDVTTLSGFTSVEKYAGQVATASGEFGLVMVAGSAVRFVQSPDASVDAGSGASGAGSAGLRGTSNNADLYTTVIFGMEYHGSVGFGFEHIKEIYQAGDSLPGVQLITKEKGSAGAGDPFNEVGTMAWKSWHAAKILNGAWGRAIRSGASTIST